jgi:nitrite reductase (NO-forming)
MITRRTALMGVALSAVAPIASGITTASANSESMTPVGKKVDLTSLPRKKVKLVPPPFVHEHDQIAKGPPSIVEFELLIVEKEHEIDDEGTMLQGMTFDGSIPGPLMVVHEGDYVELTLINPPENQLQHNIDFHSATGGLGGGALTLVNPGEKTVLRFKADRPGTFVYHCAPGGPMIPWHVVSGMSGAIMILPRDGLKDEKGQSISYDKVFYIGENDFYIPKDQNGNFKRFEDLGSSYGETLELMNGLVPTHVVFNGKAGALTGENALTAAVGESVLIVHSQANRDTRPHLIGGHGDFVWETGSFNSPPQRDNETWFIRGGSAGAALYTFRQPGVYAYVNHNLIEAVNLGATAHFVVEGDWDNDLMTQVVAPSPYGEDISEMYKSKKALP